MGTAEFNTGDNPAMDWHPSGGGGGGGSSNSPSRSLRFSEISAVLMGHVTRMQTKME